ncbi:hypothetical protein BC830DRAFT_222944 [Chytriomyces sp. MP71]|nr:hypothetical protein BC830DRAFT_222944 [Chytriomyces sp. MP71]
MDPRLVYRGRQTNDAMFRGAMKIEITKTNKIATDYGLTPERVVGFDFQGLNVDPGATYTTITLTNTSLNDFNTTFLAPFITSTLEYIVAHANYENNASSTPTDAPTPPAPVLLRQQALPTQWFPRLPFKKYNTPTWSYIPINLALLPASNKTATDDVLRTLNLTLDSQSIAQQPRPVPGSPLPVLVYIMNFTLSFTNPLSITLANPGLTLHFLVSHRGTQMLRVWTRIPPLTLGRNTRALQLDVESIPAGTAALMEWFGLYAEGVDTRLRAHRCGFDYAVRLDDGRLGWIEKMVRSWDLEVFVRGASEENEFVGLPRDSNLNGERNGWEALSEMGKAMGNVIVRQFW